jgi:hypothetical protein
VELVGGHSHCDILCNMAKACSCLSRPSRQVGFTGHLVLEQVLLRHQFGMLARRSRQTLIPFQDWQMPCQTFAIHGIEQQLFCVGDFLPSRARLCKKECKCKYLRRPMRLPIPRHWSTRKVNPAYLRRSPEKPIVLRKTFCKRSDNASLACLTQSPPLALRPKAPIKFCHI